MLANRRIALAYVCIVMVGLGMAQHMLIMVMLLQQPASTAIGFGLAAGAARTLLMPVRLTGVAASPISGRIATRYGARWALLAGCGLSLIGWSIILAFQESLIAVMVGMILKISGYSMCYVAIPAILMHAAPGERAGEVAGLSSVFRATFTAVGAQVMMTILAASTTTLAAVKDRFPSAAAYELALGFILLVCVMCTIAAWLLPMTGRSGKMNLPAANAIHVRQPSDQF